VKRDRGGGRSQLGKATETPENQKRGFTRKAGRPENREMNSGGTGRSDAGKRLDAPGHTYLPPGGSKTRGQNARGRQYVGRRKGEPAKGTKEKKWATTGGRGHLLPEGVYCQKRPLSRGNVKAVQGGENRGPKRVYYQGGAAGDRGEKKKIQANY